MPKTANSAATIEIEEKQYGKRLRQVNNLVINSKTVIRLSDTQTPFSQQETHELFLAQE
jgi:hypothetical protein